MVLMFVLIIISPKALDNTSLTITSIIAYPCHWQCIATWSSNSYCTLNQQSQWLEKKIFKLTHNLIMLNIENNDPFLPFPLLLSNSCKLTNFYYTFNHQFTQDTFKNKFKPPNLAFGHKIFFSTPTHNPTEYHPLYTWALNY